MATTEDAQGPFPIMEFSSLYEQVESQTAAAMEKLVATRGFSTQLGQAAENVAALSRLGSDAMDMLLRNLRVASRRDIVRLSTQLARNEDKLERILQELEALRDQLALPKGTAADLSVPSPPKAATNGRERSRTRPKAATNGRARSGRRIAKP